MAENFPKHSRKIVVWGLSKKRHSHRFIHFNFFKAFQRMGFSVLWREDEPKSRDVVDANSIVLASNIACSHLPVRAGAQYILHNVDLSTKNILKFEANHKVLNLQVTTKNSYGTSIDSSIAKFDFSTKTLFQPWGTPSHPGSWKSGFNTQRGFEYWVGSIWENEFGQGNLSKITDYRNALKQKNVHFLRIGGTRFPFRSGVSEGIAMHLAFKSHYSVSVVGNWQYDNQYVPCRIFRNVSSGKLPSSNADYSGLFPSGIYNGDFDQLLAELEEVSSRDYAIRVKEAQETLYLYTYENAIKRIFMCLEA